MRLGAKKKLEYGPLLLVLAVVLLLPLLPQLNSFLKKQNPQAIKQRQHLSKIDLIIEPKGLQKLARKRDEALQKGYLFAQDKDYVSARLKVDDQVLRAKVRLKGDLMDHLESNQWSFRVQLQDGASFMGMRKFSLQHPKTRRYLGEWLIQKALKSEGLFHLRFDFVAMSFNGRSLGTYAIEEHFDKILIGNNREREGIILAYDEALFWLRKAHWTGADFGNWDNNRDLQLRAFERGKIEKDPAKKKQYLAAMGKLEALRRGQLTADQVFDLEELAKFMALVDIFGGYHVFQASNFRMYYNPITQKIHPVGFDHFALTKIHQLVGQYFALERAHLKEGAGMLGELFSLSKNPKLAKHYVQNMERMSQKSYFQNFINELMGEKDIAVKKVILENPEYKFDLKILAQNRVIVDKYLNPPQHLHLSKKIQGSTVELSLGTIYQLPVEVTSILINNQEVLNEAFVVKPSLPFSPITYSTMKFPWKESQGRSPQIKVKSRFVGSANSLWNVAPQLPRYLEPAQPIHYDRPKNLSYFKKSGNSLTLAKKIVQINSPIHIPRGYQVLIPAGTDIDLVQGAHILSHSPIFFQGSAESPIRVRSSDGTGQGIAVLRADTLSKISHTIFENLKAPTSSQWELTGAVTFYKSPVQVNKATFIKNKSEDSLNIVRSPFEITDSQFRQSQSDALDVDFSKGTVAGSSFFQSGNDGADFSGSEATLTNCRFEKSGDKGLSIGENSKVKAINSEFSGNYVAVASKDLSQAEIRFSTIENGDIAFAVYQKKPEFGPSYLYALMVNAKNVKNLAVVEEGSVYRPNDSNITQISRLFATDLINKVKTRTEKPNEPN